METQTETIEACAWCGTDYRIEYTVKGAWNIEFLCHSCYMEMVEQAAESGKDFGIHNPTYPLYVKQKGKEE